MRAVDLKKYQKQLLELSSRLTGEVTRMIDSVPENVRSVGELSNTPNHPADNDSEGVEAEIMLIHNEEGILAEVDAALKRIDEGTYGRCEECGSEIATARLDAIPYTPYCIECARRIQTEEDSKG